jgi:hypothetical protein
MLSVIRYFADDYMLYRRKNAQLWWDMGYKKSLRDRVLDAIDRVQAWAWERRYAKWR